MRLALSTPRTFPLGKLLQTGSALETCSVTRKRLFSSAPPVQDDLYDWVPPVDTPGIKKISPLSPKTTPAPTNGAAQEENEASVLLNENQRLGSACPVSLTYTEDTVIPITSTLHLVKPEEDTPTGTWPVFRLMDETGDFRDPAGDGAESFQRVPPLLSQHNLQKKPSGADSKHNLRDRLVHGYPYQRDELLASNLLRPHKSPFPDTDSTNVLLRAHRQIVRLRQMDAILQDAQRQGRISFYLTCTGEEAIHFGAASALNNDDHIFAQYREQGLIMWRGFTLQQFCNQCFSNDLDLGKGRQMPIHYGSRALNYHTVSSPIGTQLPQAVGAAYRFKLQGKQNVALCLFGDGCSSSADFHAALNFAATLSAPVVFLCRNNGYAISTPVTDQFAGDGVVSRGPGYGVASIRVDGNDLFAVNAVVREAKKYALENNAPVLVEAMTYRQGHHSTSDDSLQYRSAAEVEAFETGMDPLHRINKLLKRFQCFTDDEYIAIESEERAAVLEAIKVAEQRPQPGRDTMFEDVYKEIPENLVEQRAQLEEHLAKYPDMY